MAVENLFGTKATNAKADPVVSNDVATTGAPIRFHHETVDAVETTGSNGSTWKFGPFASDIVPIYGSLLSDGTADLPDVDVGLSQVPNSAVTELADDDDSFATALDIDDTGPHTFVTYELYTANFGNPLWDYHSTISEDPQGKFYIKVSADADTVAAGTMTLVFLYTDNN